MRGVGNRRVLEHQPVRALLTDIDVAELDPFVLRRRQLLHAGERRHREVGLDRVAQRVPLRLGEVAHQAMGREHGKAGVLQRDQTHQHVPVRPLAADLLGVDAGRLIAVMAVSDQQFGVARGRLHGRDRPDPRPARGG